MKQRTLIKPAEGLRVKDPRTGLALPPEGKMLALDTYWLRRLKVGDVVKVDAPTEAIQPEEENNVTNNEERVD